MTVPTINLCHLRLQTCSSLLFVDDLLVISIHFSQNRFKYYSKGHKKLCCTYFYILSDVFINCVIRSEEIYLRMYLLFSNNLFIQVQAETTATVQRNYYAHHSRVSRTDPPIVIQLQTGQQKYDEAKLERLQSKTSYAKNISFEFWSLGSGTWDRPSITVTIINYRKMLCHQLNSHK